MPILTVFHRAPDSVIRLSWASELLFMPTELGQDPRHVGTVEPMWTLLDLTPGGRPEANEQIEYECCQTEVPASAVPVHSSETPSFAYAAIGIRPI